MGLIVDALKSLLKKAGFTVLRGDVRQDIIDNASSRGAPLHLLQNARVCADRYEVLKLLPKGGTAVEVGVAYGDFTIQILEQLRPDHFFAIDTFGIRAGDEPWGRKELEEQNCTHFEYYRKKFRTWIDQGTMTCRQGLSWELLAQMPDHSIDYLYVDADHSYASVRKEIDAFKSKIREGGLVQFNDYTYFDQNALVPYGVPKAVHEFMEEENFEMLYLCLHPQGFYDVVVRKKAL